MESPSETILRKVSQWLDYADEDLRLATYALKMRGKGRPYRLIAYHAQQCAEKYIKAFLIYHNVNFPYTHNIRKLLDLCREHATWAETLRDAEELTQYTITARYPGEDEAVTKEEAQESVEIAQRVRSQVRTALDELGLKLPE
jgi:HEPN domain-containing protein